MVVNLRTIKGIGENGLKFSDKRDARIGRGALIVEGLERKPRNKTEIFGTRDALSLIHI